MSRSVGIHPPKTPVTKGSHTIAKATIPNICKMPAPPAPFVPTPLPNIAKSELSPEGYSTSVTIEGHAVAIRGSTFESIGDIASKGTGGGLVSSNTQGPAKFISPGSMTVKIEGKSVHLLGEPMLNNCGPGGTPPNTGATMMGADHEDIQKPTVCPPHGPAVPKDGDHTQAVADAERKVQESKADLAAKKQAQVDAEAAVKNPPRGARMSQLRQAAQQAAKAIPGAEHHLKMQEQKLAAAQWEKHVADDEGGKNVKLVCACFAGPTWVTWT